jgi:hypothetical protein
MMALRSLVRPTVAVVASVATLVTLTPRARAITPVQLALHGVLGDAVSLGPPRQARTTVVFFMSRRAKEASAKLASAVDEMLLQAPVELVGIVDVRRYGGMLRSLATSYMKKSADEALRQRRERRLARGVDASPDVVNRWHLIGDFDGALFERFGVEREPARPLAFVLDRDGGVHGPYADASGVKQAFSSLSH